ncbi:hypothetical protein NEMBOFW57_000311 [Staphylotrichum longicolle]|uniref:DUF7136 domain-containing protein n=1 Tax=Staphylotrichum longicolle TaxID=669026 RepID=A0AAD4HZQ9_9PEZI|nr:hypothetical protein NEMBOFW57_000311 [Staphylotrichum longicolle]
MHWLWASATLASAAASAAQVVVTMPRHFEVDIVFPHNETYKPTDTMPIVFAVQNITVPISIGDFQLDWYIWNFPGGQFDRNRSDHVSWGSFQVPAYTIANGTALDTTLFLVGFTNVTNWFRYLRPIPAATEYTPAVDDRFVLQWMMHWSDLPETCPETLVWLKGAMMLNIQTAGGKGGSGWQGEIHDVQEPLPECPEFGGEIHIRPSSNASAPECPALGFLESAQGNPCAVKVDQAVASSISSRVSSSVASSMSKYHPTPAPTTQGVASSTSKAGVGPAHAVQTALAAVCVLCGLAL